MPTMLVPNPNPDRARRPREDAAETVAVPPTEQPMLEARTTTVTAAATDAVVEEPTAVATPLVTPAAVGIQPRPTGLNSLVPARSPAATKRGPDRAHPVWKIVKQLDETKCRCLLCGKEFAGGASRAAAHVLGPAHAVPDPITEADFAAALEKVREYCLAAPERQEGQARRCGSR